MDPQRTSPVVRPGIVQQQGDFERRLRALERQAPTRYLELFNDQELDTGWRLMLDGTGAVQPTHYQIGWHVWTFPYGVEPYDPSIGQGGTSIEYGLAVGSLAVTCDNTFFTKGTLGAGGTGYFLEPAALAVDRVIDIYPLSLEGYYQDFSAATATAPVWLKNFFVTGLPGPPPFYSGMGFMAAGGVNFTPTVPITWNGLDTMFAGQFVAQYQYATFDNV